MKVTEGMVAAFWRGAGHPHSFDISRGLAAMLKYVDIEQLQKDNDAMVTQLEEWEQASGMTLSQAMAAAHKRIDADRSYALTEDLLDEMSLRQIKDYVIHRERREAEQ